MIASGYYNDQYFGRARVAIDPEDLDGCNLLILWGGEDISTSFYGEKSVYSDSDEKLSHRDRIEKNLAEEAVRRGIPILGICRGAQLLNCLDGGKLFQHVDKHTQAHKVKLQDGRWIHS
ncbi:MAG: gamma-glutamyl-gamma-aminobutyrate hydrolase family protein, partial [Waterburya sp.]